MAEHLFGIAYFFRVGDTEREEEDERSGAETHSKGALVWIVAFGNWEMGLKSHVFCCWPSICLFSLIYKYVNI